MILKGDAKINSRIPEPMKLLIKETAEKLGMTESTYVKLALQEKLERDFKIV